VGKIKNYVETESRNGREVKGRRRVFQRVGPFFVCRSSTARNDRGRSHDERRFTTKRGVQKASQRFAGRLLRRISTTWRLVLSRQPLMGGEGGKKKKKFETGALVIRGVAEERGIT